MTYVQSENLNCGDFMQMMHGQKNILRFIQNIDSENQMFFKSKLNQNL